ncbi:MAG: DegT/DnrJ/EryC1/StrS family aminotransferase [Candidatus Undinarchaeales archaeon]|nr:DegT/DnrJ/EryC1/StrS family aminotransferase [Candidatus Undinarchaeales archaeon]MDP7492182.1 DegT/DnrJ/EryC1/StrS family aminotransferase [Candidatus Undinarchaeales archaeon]
MVLPIPRQGVSMTLAEAVRAVTSIPFSSFMEGEALARFEEAFARYLHAEHAVAVASGRYAFQLVMDAIGFTRKDEVIFPSLTIPVMPNVAMWSAAVRFADVSLENYTLDPTAAADAVTPRTRAIVPTHLYGCPCDMGSLGDLAEDRGLVMIEDCAHATGALYKGRQVGTQGVASIFSMATGKTPMAFGGGIITTDDGAIDHAVREAVAKEVRPSRTRTTKAVLKDTAVWALTRQPLFSLSVFPALALSSALGSLSGSAATDPFAEEERRLETLPAGSRGNLTNVQAVKGLSGLDHLDEELSRRRANAHALDRELADIPALTLPGAPRNAEHAYHGYCSRVKDRAGFMKRMLRRGVDTRATPMMACGSLSMFGGATGRCPTAEVLARELVHLPVHPPLGKPEMAAVARAARYVTEGR